MKRRSTSWIALVTALIVLILVLSTVGISRADTLLFAVLGSAIALLLAVLAILQSRADRKAYEAALTQQAADKAAIAVRQTLARDLHDLVSHGLGNITVRAAVARRLDAAKPSESLAALDDIENISRQATLELRRMLILLRNNESLPQSPLPNLANIPELIAEAESKGLTVYYHEENSEKMSQGMGLLVFQILQEAFLNVARYAGATVVHARCVFDDNKVIVEIVDEGPVPGWLPKTGTGQGLRGLQERVTAMQGSLSYGAKKDNGFVVRAELQETKVEVS